MRASFPVKECDSKCRSIKHHDHPGTLECGPCGKQNIKYRQNRAGAAFFTGVIVMKIHTERDQHGEGVGIVAESFVHYILPAKRKRHQQAAGHSRDIRQKRLAVFYLKIEVGTEIYGRQCEENEDDHCSHPFDQSPIISETEDKGVDQGDVKYTYLGGILPGRCDDGKTIRKESAQDHLRSKISIAIVGGDIVVIYGVLDKHQTKEYTTGKEYELVISVFLFHKHCHSTM